MLKKNYNIKAKVWRWPGVGGWHFVNVDREMSKEIRSVHTKGFVYIIAKIGKTSWDTALFPHKASGHYLLSVKSMVRKKEDIWDGDTIMISFKLK